MGTLPSELRDMAPACAAHRFQRAPRVSNAFLEFPGRVLFGGGFQNSRGFYPKKMRSPDEQSGQPSTIRNVGLTRRGAASPGFTGIKSIR